MNEIIRATLYLSRPDPPLSELLNIVPRTVSRFAKTKSRMLFRYAFLGRAVVVCEDAT